MPAAEGSAVTPQSGKRRAPRLAPRGRGRWRLALRQVLRQAKQVALGATYLAGWAWVGAAAWRGHAWGPLRAVAIAWSALEAGFYLYGKARCARRGRRTPLCLSAGRCGAPCG